jgi:hypothetical protein
VATALSNINTAVGPSPPSSAPSSSSSAAVAAAAREPNARVRRGAVWGGCAATVERAVRDLAAETMASQRGGPVAAAGGAAAEEEQESVETVTCDSCAATWTEEASVFTCGVPLCYDLCEGCYAGGVAGAAHTKSNGAAHTFVQER